MITPPLPSLAVSGGFWTFVAVHTATPFTVHCTAPAPLTRCA